MPKIQDNDEVQDSEVHMIMGFTTLIKRGTASQLIEASVFLDIVKRGLKTPMIDGLIDVSQIDPHVAVFTNRMIPESMRYMSEVSAHYGIIRVNMSCHLTMDKHQFTRVEFDDF